MFLGLFKIEKKNKIARYGITCKQAANDDSGF